MLPRSLVDGIFLATLECLLAGLIAGVQRIQTTFPSARLALGAYVTWLALLGVLASCGVFADFQSMPPRVALAIVPTMVAMLALAFSNATKRAAGSLSLFGPVALQTFRIGIEIALWQLALRQELPREMSFEGRNFDVLIGLTALPMAWWVSRGAPKWALRTWNWFGILILTNVVVTGLLSAPTRFQGLHTDPPNTIIATFPYIWLTCFAVATAYFLHIVSLRQSSLQDSRVK